MIGAAYLCWPARESGLFTGIPLQTPTIAAFGLLAWCVAFGARVPIRRGLLIASALLLVTRVVCAAWMLPSGWQASYFGRADPVGQPEPSTEYRATTWTRVDREIDFMGSSFPLHFTNELRYNVPAKTAPRFSARWIGYFRTTTAGEATMEVAWLNHVALSIDGRSVVDEQAAPQVVGRRSLQWSLPPGLHWVEARYKTPVGEPSLVRVDLRVPDADSRGAGAVPAIHPEGFTEERARLSKRAGLLLLACDVVFLLAVLCWAGATVRRIATAAPVDVARGRWRRAARFGVPLAGLGLCLLPAVVSLRWDDLPIARLSVTWGGDGLTYEDYARLALLRGPALDAGNLAGSPYEYSIGYHYWMSLVHLLFGESLLEILQANELLFFVTIGLNAIVARRLAGTRAAAVCVVLGLYCYVAVFWVKTFAYRENLVVLMNALLAFVVSRPGPFTMKRAALVGLVTGVNCLVDPVNHAIVPVVAGVVWWRAAVPDRLRLSATTIAACACCLLVFLVRNFIVAGTLDLLPTEGRSALWFGNQPPAGVYPLTQSPDGHHLEIVLAYFRAEPLHFLQGWVLKGLHAIGLYFVRFRTGGWAEIFSPAILLGWIGFLIGLVPVVRAAPWSVVTAAIGLLRGATMVVFVSYMNVDRYEQAWLVTVTPLLAATIVYVWRHNRVAVCLAVLIIGGWDYYRVFPSLSNVPFAERRQLWASSYSTLRLSLAARAATARSAWTFPADLPAWRADGNAKPVVLESAVYCQLLEVGGGLLTTLPAPVPAALVRSVRVRGGFAGYTIHGIVGWRRVGDDKLYWATFPVDQTGRVKTYEVPVSRSADWDGEIAEIGILLWGDQFTLQRFELVPFADMAPRASD